MPTSPGADLQSPPAQNALFSSPPQMHSLGGSAVGFAGLPVAIILCVLIDSSLKHLRREAELVHFRT
jgi:hypothetical protein